MADPRTPLAGRYTFAGLLKNSQATQRWIALDEHRFHKREHFQMQLLRARDVVRDPDSPDKLYDLGYALTEVIARQVEANPAKGHPMTFPGHMHQLMYPATPAVTFLDVVRASGWNDQPLVQS